MFLILLLLICVFTDDYYISNSTQGGKDCSKIDPCPLETALSLGNNTQKATFILQNGVYDMSKVLTQRLLIEEIEFKGNESNVENVVVTGEEGVSLLDVVANSLRISGMKFKEFYRPFFSSTCLSEIVIVGCVLEKCVDFAQLDVKNSISVFVENVNGHFINAGEKNVFQITQGSSLVNLTVVQSLFVDLIASALFSLVSEEGDIDLNVQSLKVINSHGIGLFVWAKRGRMDVDLIGSSFLHNFQKSVHVKGQELDMRMWKCTIADNIDVFTPILVHSYSFSMTLDIRSNRFTNNVCSECDAPFSIYGAQTLRSFNNTFANNSCERDCKGGGSIKIENCADYVDIVLREDLFYGNTIKYNFGSNIFVVECKNFHLDIYDSRFILNEAGKSALTPNGYGGAIAITSTQNIDLNIHTSSFIKNSATRGGAIFIDNTFNESTVNVLLNQSHFDGNNAVQYPKSSYEEGGMFLFMEYGGVGNSKLNLVIENSRFENHYSKFGGVIADDSSMFTDVIIRNSVFANNSGLFYGGCLCLMHANVFIVNSSFISNDVVSPEHDEYNSRGGAIYLQNGNLTLINSKFSSNYAENEGGSIFLLNSNMNLTDTTLENDRSGVIGGSLAILGSDSVRLFLSRMTSVMSSQSNYGGGIFLDTPTDSKIEIKGSVVDNNAFAGGGGVFYRNLVLEVVDMNEVEYNTAITGNDFLSSPIYFTQDDNVENRCLELPDSVISNPTHYNCTLSSVAFFDYYKQEYFIDTYDEMIIHVEIYDTVMDIKTKNTKNIKFFFDTPEDILESVISGIFTYGNSTAQIQFKIVAIEPATYWWLVFVILSVLVTLLGLVSCCIFIPFAYQYAKSKFFTQRHENFVRL